MRQLLRCRRNQRRITTTASADLGDVSAASVASGVILRFTAA
jgi:hypothetical protein